MKDKTIYFDNATTTWPKPPEVIKAMSDYMSSNSAVPGRSGHAFAFNSAKEVFETRELVAHFFNLPLSEKVIFTLNATHAINYALKGLLKKGAHVITSCLEHNAVWRPLKHLEKNNIIELDVWQVNKKGAFDIKSLERLLKPNTKAIVLTHASNVTGQVLSLNKVGALCAREGVALIADAAQTAGIIPIDMQRDNIDILIFSGHKNFYGPTGTGGLCINEKVDLEPLFQGGTGSSSENSAHPIFYPDKLEAGTLNTVGIVALKAGINHINHIGLETVNEKLYHLRSYLAEKLHEINTATVYDTATNTPKTPVVSFNLKGLPSSEVAMLLDKDYGIMCRAGIHCAPVTHKTLGTLPHGTVRFGLSLYNTKQEIDYTIKALIEISKKH